ncbi:MAG: YidH family protein [Rhodanobacteraceae bacterium]
MADQEEQEPEQIRLMKRMVELAEQRTLLAAERSRMSEDRSRMSEERSEMSAERSRMSAERSEMSEHRSYLNTERTLSVWTRTALALMVFGIAVDRFALLLNHSTGLSPARAPPHTLSTFGGAALVAFGIVMALACGIRYLAYALHWQREHTLLPWHGPYLAFSFAMMTVAFGIALLAAMLLLT